VLVTLLSAWMLSCSLTGMAAAPTLVPPGATVILGAAQSKKKTSSAPAAPDAGAPAAPSASEKKASARPPLPPDVRQLVDRMQTFYEKTQDFTADFEQRYTYKASKRKQTSTGKVTYKKPALMRWEYAGSSPRTFVLAGDKVYMHDPGAMLLTKASIGTSKLSASVSFLWGEGKLADEFAIEKRACTDCAGMQLQLTPLKPDPRFKRIFLEIDPATAQALKSTVIDPDGSENAITFKNVVINKGVDAEAFKLTPPEGTQVQDYTQASNVPR
jgi:outer membrane lipoprotein carrier protein